MGVAAACELGATPLDRPFGLADGQVHTAERALEAERHLAVTRPSSAGNSPTRA
jgi:hypothetical protein